MRRGEIRLVAGGVYASKPRPSLIVQSDLFATDSVTVCPMTTTDLGEPLLRMPVELEGPGGGARRSFLMVDELTTVRRSNVREAVGTLSPSEMLRFERLMLVFLGIGA